ncbi:MAG: VCBS repeat-containing protein, partial [Psychrosphaera sp.]|nr:VCBS repeat-containing protein [Psychrosphaera sp.]
MLQVTDDRGAVAEDTMIVSVVAHPKNPYNGATVQAGEKIEWHFNINDWSTDFRVESEVPVALSVFQLGGGPHDRWLMAPMVSEPVEIRLLLVDESDPSQDMVIDTVTVMPNEQIGFKQTLPTDKFYEYDDFGSTASPKFELIANDAFVDLVLTKSGKISWFVGKGDGTFGVENVLLETENTPSIRFEDINKDGHEDLVLVYRGDNSRIVWHEKRFTPLAEFGPTNLIAQYPQTSSLRDYALADIDNDGALELISAYHLEGEWTLSMHRQLADGQYGAESIIDHRMEAVTSLSITMAHLDEGGFLDIGLMLHTFSTDFGNMAAMGQYLSRDNGSQFDVPENFTIQYSGDIQLNSLFDLDVNNDGVKDNFQVVTTTYLVGGIEQVACLSGYLSNGVEGRTYQGDIICASNYLSNYGLNDIDGDGDLDLVFHSDYSSCGTCFDAKIIGASYLGFLENNGSIFSGPAKVILYTGYTTFNSSPRFIGADYDGDADQDILIWQDSLGCDECTFEWYQQTK